MESKLQSFLKDQKSNLVEFKQWYGPNSRDFKEGTLTKLLRYLKTGGEIGYNGGKMILDKTGITEVVNEIKETPTKGLWYMGNGVRWTVTKTIAISSFIASLIAAWGLIDYYRSLPVTWLLNNPISQLSYNLVKIETNRILLIQMFDYIRSCGVVLGETLWKWIGWVVLSFFGLGRLASYPLWEILANLRDSWIPAAFLNENVEKTWRYWNYIDRKDVNGNPITWEEILAKKLNETLAWEARGYQQYMENKETLSDLLDVAVPRILFFGSFYYSVYQLIQTWKRDNMMIKQVEEDYKTLKGWVDYDNGKGSQKDSIKFVDQDQFDSLMGSIRLLSSLVRQSIQENENVSWLPEPVIDDDYQNTYLRMFPVELEERFFIALNCGGNQIYPTPQILYRLDDYEALQKLKEEFQSIVWNVIINMMRPTELDGFERILRKHLDLNVWTNNNFGQDVKYVPIKEPYKTIIDKLDSYYYIVTCVSVGVDNSSVNDTAMQSFLLTLGRNSEYTDPTALVVGSLQFQIEALSVPYKEAKWKYVVKGVNIYCWNEKDLNGKNNTQLGLLKFGAVSDMYRSILYDGLKSGNLGFTEIETSQSTYYISRGIKRSYLYLKNKNSN